jgi:hypothetical protein
MPWLTVVVVVVDRGGGGETFFSPNTLGLY